MTDYPVSTWPHGINLEVLTQDPSSQSFRLDNSPLDTARLAGDLTDLFRLDNSYLDLDTLGPPSPPMVWWDITGPALSVSTLAGVRQDSALVKPETGTLTATIKNAPNLLAAGVKTGSTVRLRRGDRPLWFGRVEDYSTTWHKAGGSTTVLTASDWLASAGRITRYGRQVADESAADRFCALIWESLDQEIPLIHFWGDLGTAGARPVAPVLDEISLADHLQMAANTGNFLWSSRPALEVADAIVRPRIGSTPGRYKVWSDVAGSPRSFLSVEEGSATAQIINTLEITQHTIATENGSSQATTSQKTVKNAPSVANWGTRSATADIAAAKAVDIDAVANELLTINRAISTTVTQMVIWGADWLAAVNDQPETLAPLSAVPVQVRGVTHDLLVSAVSHDITPKRWTTTVQFIRRT